MNDLISIIVPVYNVSDYLKECIESIIRQTYTNLEILLINDGSTDNSGQICDSYAKKYKRIKVIHQANQGLSISRNNGIKLSKGKYLSFVDSDDIIDEKMIEILHKEIINNNCDISICKFQIFHNNYIPPKEYYKTKLMDKNEFLKKLMIDKEISSHACNKLCKKNLFKEIKFTEGKKYEDISTTYKLGLKLNKACYIDIELYGYRVRNNSIINNLKKETLIDYIDMTNKRYEDLIQKKLELKSYIDMNRINSTTRYFLEIIRHNQEILLKDKELKEKLDKELLIAKNLIRKETRQLSTLKENIANQLLLDLPQLFFVIMRTFYKIKKN